MNVETALAIYVTAVVIFVLMISKTPPPFKILISMIIALAVSVMIIYQ